MKTRVALARSPLSEWLDSFADRIAICPGWAADVGVAETLMKNYDRTGPCTAPDFETVIEFTGATSMPMLTEAELQELLDDAGNPIGQDSTESSAEEFVEVLMSDLDSGSPQLVMLDQVLLHRIESAVGSRFDLPRVRVNMVDGSVQWRVYRSDGVGYWTVLP